MALWAPERLVTQTQDLCDDDEGFLEWLHVSPPPPPPTVKPLGSIGASGIVVRQPAFHEWFKLMMNIYSFISAITKTNN